MEAIPFKRANSHSDKKMPLREMWDLAIGT